MCALLFPRRVQKRLQLHKLSLREHDLHNPGGIAINYECFILNHVSLLSCQEARQFMVPFATATFAHRVPSKRKPGSKISITVDKSASPTDLQLSKSMLQFCLRVGIELSDLLEAMTENTGTGDALMLSEGAVFCAHYQEVIHEFILSLPQGESMPQDKGLSASSYATALLQKTQSMPYLYDVVDKFATQLLAKGRADVLDAIVSELNKPNETAASVPAAKLRLIRTLARWNPVPVFANNPQSPELATPCAQNFIACLSMQDDLSVIIDALSVVPFVLNVSDDTVVQPVIEAIEKICTDRITCFSDPHDLQAPDRSKELADYLLLLNKLLAALQHCGSFRLVQVLYPLLLQETHFHATTIHAALENFAANSASQCFEISWQETRALDLQFGLRRCLMEHVCIPMLLAMPTDEEAFTTISVHIEELFVDIGYRDDYAKDEDARARTLHGWGRARRERAALSFTFLQAVYRRLGIIRGNNTGGPHIEKLTACLQKVHRRIDKSMSLYLYQQAKAVLLEDCSASSTDNEEVDFRVYYHSTAFQAFVESLIRCYNQPKIFDMLLFNDKKTYDGNMWANIVNTGRTLEFFAESVWELQNRELGALQEQRQLDRQNVDPFRTLSSQYLQGSSLAIDEGYTQQEPEVDVHKDDATWQPASQSLTMEISDAMQTDSAAEGAAVTAVHPEAQTELDPLNQNPCMAMLMRAVRRRIELDDKKPGEPGWIKNLRKTIDDLGRKIANADFKPNVLLFLVKIILNRPTDFCHYADDFVETLVLVATADGKNGGWGIHYYVRDICATILKWIGHGKLKANTMVEPSQDPVCTHIQTLVHHLCRNALKHDLRAPTWRQILKCNLMLIQNFVEIYKLEISVDGDIIHSHLIADDDKHRSVGIQLLALCIKNGVQITQVDMDALHRALIDNLDHKRKDVYVPAAETLAFAFKEGEIIWGKGQIFKYALSTIQRMEKQGHYERYLVCIHKVASGGRTGAAYEAGYPKIGEPFVTAVANLLRRVGDEAKARGLAILAFYATYLKSDAGMRVGTRAQKVSDLLIRIRSWLDDFLQTRHSGVQLVSLKLLYLMLTLIEPDSVRSDFVDRVLPILCKTFAQHRNSKCRQLSYEIMIWIWNNEVDHTSSDSNLRHDLTRDSLVRGLADEGETVRLVLQNFWHDADRLGDNLKARIPILLSTLYIPEVEDRWPGQASYFLLKLCDHSDKYEEALHQSLDPSASFDSHDINSGWQAKSNPLTTPLFRESQIQSQSGFLDATQASELNFTETFADTLDGDSAAENLGADSSMMFVDKHKSFSQVAASQTQSSDFKMPAPRGRADASETIVTGLARFKRNASIPTNAHRFRNTESRKRVRETFADHKQMTSKRVRMLRRYKKGELPDVRVSSKDIIEPLRDLAQKDRLFSKMLCGLLFEAVLDKSYVEKLCANDPMSRRGQFLEENVGFLFEMLLKTNASATFVSWLLGIIEQLDWDQIERTRGQQSVIGLIGDASLRSHNFHSGIRALEQLAIKANSREVHARGASSKRSRTSERLPEEELWVQLGALYGQIGEDDTAIAISIRSTQEEKTQAAIKAEIGGEFDRARGLYQSVLSAFVSPDSSKDSVTCQKGLIKCQAKLLQWDEVRGGKKDGHFDGLAGSLLEESDHSKHEYITQLRTFFQSCMSMAGRDEADRMERCQFVSDWMRTAYQRHPEVKRLVENTQQKHLAILEISKDDFGRAEHFINQFYEKFLIDWSNYHKLANAARTLRLQELQSIVEVREFIQCYRSLQSRPDDAQATTQWFHAKKLLASWSKRMPSAEDDARIWDGMLSDRLLFFDRFARVVQEQETPGPAASVFLEEINQHTNSLYRKVITAARIRGDYFTMKKYLGLAVSRDKKKGAAVTDAWSLDIIQMLLLDHARHPDMITRCSNSLSKFQDRINIMAPGDTYHLNKPLVYEVKARICEQMAVALHNSGTEPDVSRVEHSDIVWHVRSATDAYLQTVGENAGQIAECARIQYQFGRFCDSVLGQKNGAGHPMPCDSRSAMEKCMVEQLLGAMAQGHRGAQMLFPRILKVLADSSTGEMSRVFQHHAANVPTWMFLPWIHQMISRINIERQESRVLVDLLVRVAGEYPQAVFYPFFLSRPDFDTKGKEISEPIWETLRPVRDVLMKFVEAVELLADPWSRVDGWLDELEPQIKQENVAASKVLMRAMHKNIFGPNRLVAGELNYNFARGKLCESAPGADKLATESKRVLDMLASGVKTTAKTFGTEFQQKFSSTKKDFRAAADQFLKGAFRNTKYKKNPAVESYSVFLSDLAYSGTGECEIVMPGMYDGFDKPDIRRRVTIVRTAPDIVRMESLRAPKVIRFFGSDEREHKFLAKSGEDLRLDQRLEQLFTVMNDQMSSDPKCRKGGLNIRTFGVTPTSKRAGLLQWVENTKVFNEILSKERASAGKEVINGELDKLARGNPVAACQAMNEKEDANRVATIFESAVNRTNPHLFTNYLVSLATSAEAYLAIRKRFSTTLATFNIASYIAGVGDRHLGNFLLDRTDGSVVGIDFGYSFGVPQMLPIPELIPFRLSPQLLDVMKPLDASGLLKQTTVHTMRVLRTNRESLLNIMQVFVDEPLMDWTTFALKAYTKLNNKKGVEFMRESIETYPAKAIMIASQKLDGRHPAKVLMDQIKDTYHRNSPKHIEGIKRVLWRRGRVRERITEEYLDVNDQVETLIDIATDPSILGRAFTGAQLWM
jgi:DNA-dependent protein kinase catalytic subunit